MRTAITTVDNPFNPFTDFDSWFRFDCDKGYNTCAYLARISRPSETNSEKENEEAVEEAIDEIIQYDFMNIYRKIDEKNAEKQLESFKKEKIGEI
jgi:hypothetical protein